MTEAIGDVEWIKDETPDVKTIKLRLNNQINFIPGQYGILSIIGKKELETRPFTFTNSPTEKGVIELTIKKMGVFTTALHSLNKGARLKIDGPYGEALNFDESKNAVFIAGGSGITPFISAIRYAFAKNLDNSITLLYSNKTINDIIYKKELDEIINPNIKIIHALSNEILEGWKGERGRISKEMIEKYVDKGEDKLWYICGPTPMVEAVKEILASIQIPDEKIRVENWQIQGK